MLVEDIQDLVEQGLVAENKFHLAKTYIIYRYNRALVRKANTTDESILSLLRNENKELAEENSNKNTMIAATQRDYIAGEVSRDLTRRILLPEYISKAHDEGPSTSTTRTTSSSPSSTAASSTSGHAGQRHRDERQAHRVPQELPGGLHRHDPDIACVASNQYGGQSFTLSHLAPFVDISRQKIKRKSSKNGS